MKNKIYLVLITVVIFNLNLIGQSINFEDSNWDTVKEKAKKEKKIIFVDCYASWCGPCKWMAKNTFTNDTVGKFYNENFISYKLDAEKGEGITFAANYKVTAYPSLFFIEYTGKLLHKAVGGLDAKTFIKLGQTALNPEKRLSFWTDEYQKGNRKTDFIKKYIYQLENAGMDYKEAVDLYFASQNNNDLLTKENIKMIQNYINDIDSKTFQYFLNNRDKFSKVYNKDSVNDIIYNIYFNNMIFALRTQDDVKLNSIKDKVKKSGLESSDKLIKQIDIYTFQGKNDWKNYAKTVIEFVNKYCMNDWQSLNDYAWKFFENENITDKIYLKNAVDWAKKSVELNSNYYNNDTYSNLLYKTKGDKKTAIEAAEKAIELGKNDGQDTKSTEELLKNLKGK